MDALAITGCVLKSKEEVELMEDERDRRSWSQTPTAWCLSQSAADRARAMSWTDVVEIQGKNPAEALVRAMLDRIEAQGSRAAPKPR
jgi:hypothetical protein